MAAEAVDAEEVADWWDWDAAEAAGELEPEPNIAQGVHMGAGAGLLGPGLLPEGAPPHTSPLCSTCLSMYGGLAGARVRPRKILAFGVCSDISPPVHPGNQIFQRSSKYSLQYYSACTCTPRMSTAAR